MSPYIINDSQLFPFSSLSRETSEQFLVWTFARQAGSTLRVTKSVGISARDDAVGEGR